MRYNIKRLVKEHESYKLQLDELLKQYNDGKDKGLPYLEYSKNTSEINRLRHAMSLCRQYIGQEIIARVRTDQFYRHDEHITDVDYAIVKL